MRDYAVEFENRVSFIRKQLAESGGAGIVYGNSGGKDSALVGILCKAACDNTLGLILPCASSRNFGSDMEDARLVAAQFRIEQRTIDLSGLKTLAESAFGAQTALCGTAVSNLAPRLRMLALYAVAASEHRRVAGTGNRSEIYMGYFTKWGDGACDFNPIADLTVTEIYEFLRHLKAPASILEKAPSAGLFEGQTDEGEMGVTYAAIDRFLLTGEAAPEARAVMERYHGQSGHKRAMPAVYREP